jgi:hypothetical protein
MNLLIRIMFFSIFLLYQHTVFADTFTSMGTIKLSTGTTLSEKKISKIIDDNRVEFISKNASIGERRMYSNEFELKIFDSKNNRIINISGHNLTGVIVQKIITDTSRIFYEIGTGHATSLYVFDKNTNVSKLIYLPNIIPDMQHYGIEVIDGKLYVVGSDVSGHGETVCSYELFWDGNVNWMGYKAPQKKYYRHKLK